MYDAYKDPDNPCCPEYKTFDEKAQIAIEKRLQAEREWMEFIVAVGIGRIRENLHDIGVRMDREVEEERRQRALLGADAPPRRRGRDLI